MRIAFILIGNGRRSTYINGDTMRYGGSGVSGTDSSTILVAEYLSSIGHDVVIATDELEEPKEEHKKYQHGDIIRGVCYTNLKFDSIDNVEFDILITSLWFSDYDTLPITVTKSLIYWSHMQWIYSIDDMLSFVKNNNLKLRVVNISNWEKSMNQPTLDRMKKDSDDFTSVVISNPIQCDIIEEVLNLNIEKKKHKFIFHASWARGGDVAYNTIKKLEFPNKEFHVFDYLMTIHDYKDSWFHRHDGVDKLTLFKHLAESEYFIYPLYTPYKDVHKDTFSCVVAEAIAFGTIPLTYPLGALPENFNDFCIWLDVPNGIKIEELQKEPLTKDLKGEFKDNISTIIQNINKLEGDHKFKDTIKEQGKQYILNKFSINNIGSQWEVIINSI